jgi:uncharacterized protein (DUF58 family)
MRARAPFPRLHITRPGGYWLLVVTGFLVTGLTKNINLILVLGNFLVALFLLNVWLAWRSLRSVTVVPAAPASTFAGEPMRWRADVAAARRVSGLRLAGSLAGAAIDCKVQAVAAGGTAAAHQNLRPLDRGTHGGEPIRLECAAPFGLVVAQISSAAGRAVTVYPRRGVIRLNAVVGRLRAVARAGQRRVAVRHLGDGTDIHGLRQFRTGDSPRWIHWKTTARVGELMVREFDRAAGPSLSVAVDGAALRGPGFEAALSFVTTLVAAWGATQDGRLALLLPREGRYEAVEIHGHRRATAALARLGDWPADVGTLPAGPPLELLPEGRPVLHVTRGPTRLARVDGGSSRRPVLGRLDPAAPSDIYTPPSDDDA